MIMKNAKLKLSIYICVTNILDAFFTHHLVSNGIAIELNPLMAFLLDCNVILFYLIKITMTTLCVLYLALSKESQYFKNTIPLYAIAVIYSIIMIVHFFGFFV